MRRLPQINDPGRNHMQPYGLRDLRDLRPEDIHGV
jgi:hypothetical protein